VRRSTSTDNAWPHAAVREAAAKDPATSTPPLQQPARGLPMKKVCLDRYQQFVVRRGQASKIKQQNITTYAELRPKARCLNQDRRCGLSGTGLV